MRLATWNTYRGDCFEKAALLDSLDPDVIILQECARPDCADYAVRQWFGDNPLQGIATVTPL